MSDADTQEFETLDPLAAAEAKREARKAKARKARDEQKAVDLDAIDTLEIKHGDAKVAHVEVGHRPGLPVLVACRCPRPAEITRYRARLKGSKGQEGDAVQAAEEIGGACRIYPEADAFKQLCDEVPGLLAQLGTVAVKLAVGREESEGKG